MPFARLRLVAVAVLRGESGASLFRARTVFHVFHIALTNGANTC